MSVLSQISGVKTLLDPGIINTQEPVLSGGHVDEIRLALGAFLVQELVYRLVSGGLAEIGADDLVRGLAQKGRAAFGGWIALVFQHNGRFYPCTRPPLASQTDRQALRHRISGPRRRGRLEEPAGLNPQRGRPKFY